MCIIAVMTLEGAGAACSEFLTEIEIIEAKLTALSRLPEPKALTKRMV